MRFSATTNSLGPKTVSPPRPPRQGGDRLMLQVPTLANTGAEPNTPNKRARYEEQSSASLHRPSPVPMNWSGYRPDDPYADAKAWGSYYPDPGRVYHVPMYSDSRYSNHNLHHGPISAADNMGSQASSIYPPPQVRSGRGAMRMRGPALPLAASPVNAPTCVSRSSFPVSNRGKGRKTPVANRPADTPASRPSGTLSPPTALATLEEAQRIGNSVKGGVAMAVSRKIKRKLPLARNIEKDLH